LAKYLKRHLYGYFTGISCNGANCFTYLARPVCFFDAVYRFANTSGVKASFLSLRVL